MTGQEVRTGWSHFKSRLCHCFSQTCSPMELERKHFPLYPALWILKHSLSLQQNKPQILEFYKKKNTLRIKTANSYSSALSGGLSTCVLVLVLPKLNNIFQFVTIFPQFFYSAIPPCWEPSIPGFLFSFKKKKNNKPTHTKKAHNAQHNSV